ncbi:uncharacterized protein LOC108733192 [Agrilus planipennis]|uniref:Uncharacterized protein LOC108733192 n=1 Tax=Agrilus planipennis TaxID=224129 RepID=A0A1W4W6P2_AGRPL|nr:uncharacterized protein LOC108733192 [Agrilus planipennis]
MAVTVEVSQVEVLVVGMEEVLEVVKRMDLEEVVDKVDSVVDTNKVVTKVVDSLMDKEVDLAKEVVMEVDLVKEAVMEVDLAAEIVVVVQVVVLVVVIQDHRVEASVADTVEALVADRVVASVVEMVDLEVNTVQNTMVINTMVIRKCYHDTWIVILFFRNDVGVIEYSM